MQNTLLPDFVNSEINVLRLDLSIAWPRFLDRFNIFVKTGYWAWPLPSFQGYFQKQRNSASAPVVSVTTKENLHETFICSPSRVSSAQVQARDNTCGVGQGLRGQAASRGSISPTIFLYLSFDLQLCTARAPCFRSVAGLIAKEHSWGTQPYCLDTGNDGAKGKRSSCEQLPTRYLTLFHLLGCEYVIETPLPQEAYSPRGDGYPPSYL